VQKSAHVQPTPFQQFLSCCFLHITDTNETTIISEQNNILELAYQTNVKNFDSSSVPANDGNRNFDTKRHGSDHTDLYIAT